MRDMAKRNSDFALGLGIGLGNYIFTYLSSEEQIRTCVSIDAKENSELTRGLGIGLGRIFPYLSLTLKNKYFKTPRRIFNILLD